MKNEQQQRTAHGRNQTTNVRWLRSRLADCLHARTTKIAELHETSFPHFQFKMQEEVKKEFKES